MPEPVQEHIGNYELLDLIGDGAQGKVFKARCAADSAGGGVKRGDIVAIKVLRISTDDEKAHARFKRQADILKGLSHPNIVRYHDTFTWHPGEWDEAECLVLEYLEGETFDVLMKRNPRGLPWLEAQAIFEQCLDALIYAGKQDIIHRDLKPSNIFLTRAGSVKIFDFDISRRVNETQLSTTGWKGTFDYMAPDFVLLPDFHGDEISDIYSLGVCIFQALTGKLPFEPLGEGAHLGYLNRWRDGGAKMNPAFRGGIFRVLAGARTFLGKCFNPQRAQRFQNFAETLAEFKKIHFWRIGPENQEAYELTAFLGRGGAGEVFKGRRLADGLTVALKHLLVARQSSRFLKEAKILQRYPHPHLVQYIDYLSLEGAGGETQYFLVLEFLEGMPEWSLRNRIESEGRLEPGEALELFSRYLAALDSLHQHPQPIIHRDIKPENLYAPRGHPERAKIFDLGVARDVKGTATSGGVPGTIDYMAPELLLSGNERGTPQADIYALGLCLYEALTGRPLFKRLPTDLSAAWVEFNARSQAPPRLADDEIFRKYPALKEIIARSASEQPQRRYAKAGMMQAELDRLRESMRGQARAPAQAAVEEFSRTMATMAPVPEAKLAAPPHAPAATPKAPARANEPADTWDAEADAFELTMMTLALRKDERGRRLLSQFGAAVKQARRRLWLWAAAAALVLALAAGTIVAGLAWQQHRTVQLDQDSIRERQEIERMLIGLIDPAPAAASAGKILEAADRIGRAQSKYPRMAAKWDENLSVLTRSATQLQARSMQAFTEAVAQKKKTAAEKLFEEWRGIQGAAIRLRLDPVAVTGQTDKMRQMLSRMDFEIMVDTLCQIVPEKITNAPELAQAEQATTKLEALESDNWPGMSPADKQELLSRPAALLSEKIKTHIEDLRRQADAKFQRGERADAEREALTALAKQAPLLTARARQAYADALTDIDLAGKSAERNKQVERKQAQDKIAAAQAEKDKALADQLGKIADIRRSVKAGRDHWQEALRTLAGLAAAATNQPQVKSEWDAAVKEFTADLAGAIAQQEPLAERPARLNLADQVLGLPETEQVFGTKPDNLRNELARQKTRFILRLINRSGQQLAISGAGLPEGNISIENDGSKDFELAADSKTTTRLTLLAEGSAGYKPRREYVNVTGGGAQEIVVPALEAERKVSPVEQPKIGMLKITVTPSAAVCYLDGKPVNPGAIQVSASGIHTLRAEAPGYQKFTQVIKLNPGETRTVEIVLEKEKSKGKKKKPDEPSSIWTVPPLR